MIANATGNGLSRETMARLWGLHLNGDSDDDDPYAVPSRAADFRGLPYMILIIAEHDLLRDDGRAYAEALAEADVAVAHRDYLGIIHGFFNYASYIRRGHELREELARELRRAIAHTAR